MSYINTISEFLLQAGTDYRIFDLGRAIRPISSQDFLDIELTKIPAPYPRQQHAWFGIVFFNPTLNQSHYIWFVKLPLDEQGLLISAATNQFLQIVVEALGEQLEKTQKIKDGLPENPYTFTPPPQQLADFNSISRNILNLPLSKHYNDVINYLRNPETENWQSLPLQGIADVASTIEQKEIKTLFLQNFMQLELQVQIAFCRSFENHIIDLEIAQLLLTWYQEQPHKQDRLSNLIRGLCQATNTPLIQTLLFEVLQSPAVSNDLLILIAARHWQQLNNKTLMKHYIDCLCQAEQGLFIGLFSDLVQVPSLRNTMMEVLRWPDKRPELTEAIAQLFEGSNK